MRFKKIKIFVVLFIVFPLVFYFSLSTFAATILGQPMDDECIKRGNCQLIDFLKIGRVIIKFLLGATGVVALVFFITGGITMIVSGGKQDRVLTAKRMIGFSIIGMIIAFLAWQIVNLVICGVTQGQLQETCQIFGRPWNVFPQ